MKLLGQIQLRPPEVLMQLENPDFEELEQGKYGATRILDKQHNRNAKSSNISMKERLKNYISISIFMAMLYGMEEEALRILYYNQQLANDLSPRHRCQLMDSELFVSDLIEQVIKYDEKKIFDLIFTRISNWDILFKEDVLKVYM